MWHRRTGKVDELKEALAKLTVDGDESEGRKAQIKGITDEIEMLEANEKEFQTKEEELKAYVIEG